MEPIRFATPTNHNPYKSISGLESTFVIVLLRDADQMTGIPCSEAPLRKTPAATTKVKLMAASYDQRCVFVSLLSKILRYLKLNFVQRY